MQRILFLIYIIYSIIPISARCQNAVACYSFSKNVNDSSGNNYNGSLEGNASVANDYLQIGNNTSDYLKLSPAILNNVNDFTITFKVEFNNFHINGSSPPTNHIFSGDDSISQLFPGFGLAYQKNINSWRMGFNVSGYEFQDQLRTNTWYCVLLTRKDGVITLYRDGLQIGSSYTNTSIVPIQSLEIGQETDCLGGCFDITQCLNGNIDNLQFYNQAASQLLINSMCTYSCNAPLTNSCTLDVTPDTSVCNFPNALQLNANLNSDSPAVYQWIPTTELNNPNIANPIATITTPITYYVSASGLTGPQLVENGDFEDGDVDFTTSYLKDCSSDGLDPPDYYCITSNPANVHSGTTGCGDHTTGSGLMMVVNGSTTSDSKVWEQTVNVSPNTNYQFSFCSANWSSVMTGLTEFDVIINGIDQQQDFQINAQDCDWKRFLFDWNAGANSTADIQIIDLSNIYDGNDFLLDDISLLKICSATDSIRINFVPIQVKTSALSKPIYCSGDTVQLHTFVSPDTLTNIIYNWVPANGLNCTNCPDPVSTIDSSTSYIINVTSSAGCEASDTVNINAEKIELTTSGGNICIGDSTQLQTIFSPDTLAGVTYQWFPSSGLNCITCPNPFAQPTDTTTYYVIAKTPAGCSAEDSVKVIVRLKDIISLSVIPSATIFAGDSVQLTATGGFNYSWVPPTGLNCTNCPNPIAKPDSSTTYFVMSNDGKCSSEDTITITVLPVCKDLALPSAFTPNGDGHNDVYHLLYNSEGNLQLKYFRIYNRWGQEVFESDNFLNGWDGKFNGKPEPIGTYVWVVDAICNGKEVFQKGNVTLLR